MDFVLRTHMISSLWHILDIFQVKYKITLNISLSNPLNSLRDEIIKNDIESF